MISRLRNAGYLRAVGIQAQPPADTLEQLISHLGGGDAGIKFHYVIDRRDFLQKINSLSVKRKRAR